MDELGRSRLTAAVVCVAIALPFLILRRTALAPSTNLVAALPSANPLDDPTTNATALARAWARWDRGDWKARDDRVYAPAPNALATGEWTPLAALVGYPFRTLTGSLPLGVNVPYFLALATFPIFLYALYARLAGPGAVAALAAIAVAYGPGRINSLGVLALVFNGLVFLVVLSGADWLRKGRVSDLLLFGVALLAQGLASLYGLAMGLVWGIPAILLLARRSALSFRRTGALLLTGGAVLALLLLPYSPYLRMGDEIGIVTSNATFEQHAADLLSLLHGGIFGGPVRNVLERLAPGFPLGAAAFFPTLAFTFALAAWAVTTRGRDRSPLPWLVLAFAMFLFALGPTVRFAGRPLLPGPYRILTGLPVFSSLRGIHRYDQWFDISLGAAAVLALSAVRERASRGRGLLVAFALLVTLDVWPADIPSFRFPVPSPYVRELESLPRDALVAVYPWNRGTSTQAWVDQLSHGRRVINGWFSYGPPLHAWAEKVLPSMSVGGGLALLRELGASVAVVDLGALDPGTRREADLLAQSPPAGVSRVSEATPFRLFWLEARAPCLVETWRPPPLVFNGTAASVPCGPGRLVFRLGRAARTVRIVDGRGSVPAIVGFPLVSPSPMRISLSRRAPAGAAIQDVRSGSLMGRIAPESP